MFRSKAAHGSGSSDMAAGVLTKSDIWGILGNTRNRPRAYGPSEAVKLIDY